MAVPATPLPASTVVLVRPNAQGRAEVFMNRRPERMDTYAGVHVFPGGRVERDDCSSEMLELTFGVKPEEARATLKSELDPASCLGYWVAAVRELFEEAGIHFFVDTNRPSKPDEEIARRLALKRSELQQGTLTLSSLLRTESLGCDLSRLKYIFHRVTPERYKIRFDTRFYLAALPERQVPLPTSEEVAESMWVAPDVALMETTAGRFPMMPPTIAVLQSLADHKSWDDLKSAYEL